MSAITGTANWATFPIASNPKAVEVTKMMQPMTTSTGSGTVRPKSSSSRLPVASPNPLAVTAVQPKRLIASSTLIALAPRRPKGKRTMS